MSVSGEQHPAIKRVRRWLFLLATKEGKENVEKFVPRPTDVFVVTAPKCGTTWMQQIMHQLRSGGDMTFDDIDDVVPWIELAYDVGQDLEDEHKYQPRCFKTHTWYDACPKGAKYIVVYREPCAAFYSGFKFVEGVHFEPGEVTLDEFVRGIFFTRNEIINKNYFEHLVSWWPKRNDSNVLILLYEDMLEDLESAVKAVSLFMGIDDENIVTNAVEMSRFEFMKQHQERFAMDRVSTNRNKATGLPQGARFQRVAKGSATEGREAMEESTKQAVQDMWNEIVTKETGLRDYNELRNALKREKQS